VSEAVREAAREIERRLGGLKPRVAIVLGSGLGPLAEEVQTAVRIPYAEIPGFPAARVAGHAGELVIGMLEGVPVIVQSGRFHLYEGHSPATAALPVRVFATLGVGTLLVTNAAGGLRETFTAGTLMMITDHINLMARNPLVGPVEEGEERFPDMSDPYDLGLRQAAREAAREANVRLEEGVYVALLGPSYETPAEVRMLQRLGGDAVGMSTVPEVIVARARGIRCLGFSIVTNPASGLVPEPLAHADVLAATRRVAGELGRVVRGVLRRLTR
jgi:purine-nucleoside phosphorylase